MVLLECNSNDAGAIAGIITCVIVFLAVTLFGWWGADWQSGRDYVDDKE